jgi:hypothetical protein
MRPPQEEVFLRRFHRNNAPGEVELVNLGSGEFLAQGTEEKA